MDFRPSNKRIFVLGLLLIIVVGVFLWQVRPFGQDYFKWLKSLFLGQESLLSEDSGLDLSEINLPAFAEATASKEETVLVEEIEQSQETKFIFEPKLVWIKKEIDEIAEEVEKIDQEVKKLMALSEIQKEINDIAREITRITQEVEELSYV